jgi:hypothetical protein
MHCCIITCKIPQDMSFYTGKHLMRSFVYPTLEEFGYVLPEGDLQEKVNRRYQDCTKECSLSIFLEDEEAIKTASVRAEWKPLDTTMELDGQERKALRRMSRKRPRSESSEPCHICLEPCDRPTTIECEHTFCYDCIKKWMGIKRQCPVCDEPISVEKYVRKKRLKIPCKRTLPR